MIKKTTDKYFGALHRGYLKIAKLGFSAFKEHEESNKIFPVKNQISVVSLGDGNLLIASIWNVKHALELVLKKDGDLVEVDANAGVVEILKRAVEI